MVFSPEEVRVVVAKIDWILVRCGKAQNLDTISEIGIFGIYLHETKYKDDSGILINNNDGYLVRTKPAQSNVGGVNVGGACIDSLYLVEWQI